MRVSVTLGMFLLALAFVAPASAQAKKDKEKAVAAPTSRAILANLQVEVKTSNLANPLKFSEFLELTRDELQKNGREVTFAVDDEAFRDDMPEVPIMHDVEIRFKNLPPKATVYLLLRQALKQLPGKGAFVVRGGKVDIVPLGRTSKEFMLNQTFHVDFKESRLDVALEELSELTGVSIVVDARAKQKVQTTVTARFHDDVALQDAVRMLTDMGELKIVYLVTGMYITTPEHAKEMQKELKDLYEPKSPPAGFGAPGGAPVDPWMFEPSNSPLAPPLPPPLLRGKRIEAAA